jgi:NDP-sugar pyrophosphorylase family protein
MFPVIVLAGGLASRLGEVSRETPKVLLDVAGRPFAEWQLEWLRANGVAHVIYAVGHLGEQVAEALGDGTRWGMTFSYAFDGATLLGTGGAVRRALAIAGDNAFVVYGDSLLDCALAPVSAAYRQSGCAALMTVCRNDNRWDRSNVRFEGGRLLAYDKRRQTPEMQHIDYGLGIVSRRVFAAEPEDVVLDLADVYARQLAAHQLVGYEVHGRFYEIGSHAGLAETRAMLETRSTGQP